MKQKLLVFLITTLLVVLMCTACSKTETVVICGHCSAKVSENSQYCSNCGGSLFQYSGDPSDAVTDPPIIGSELTEKEVIDNLEAILEPVSDQFQMTKQPRVDLGEKGFSAPLVVTESIAEKEYQIGIYTNQSGEVYGSYLMTARGTYTELDFALLSFYLYKSFNLPEMEAQDFYDQLGLLTEEPEGRMSVAGWKIWVMNTNDYLFFDINYEQG